MIEDPPHSSLSRSAALGVVCSWAFLFCLCEPVSGQGRPVEARRASTFGTDDLMLPVFAPGSEADADLGVQMILDPLAEYDPLTVAAYAGYEFSDNANVSSIDPQSDHYFNSSILLSYLPALVGNLYGEVSGQYETFRYNQHSELDFSAVDAGAGLLYVIRSLGDLSVYSRYNYTEYWDAHDLIPHLYSNHSIQAGVYKEWIPARNQFIYASALSEVSVDADPGFAKRDEHSLVVGYRVVPIRKLKGDVFYRAIFLDYDEAGREDWNHTAGAALSWNFTPNIYVTGHISYIDNNSNEALFGDYKAWITGLRLGGYWQF